MRLNGLIEKERYLESKRYEIEREKVKDMRKRERESKRSETDRMGKE